MLTQRLAGSHLYFTAEGARRGCLTCRVTDWDPGPRSLGPAHGGDAPAPGLRGASRRSLRGTCVLVPAAVPRPVSLLRAAASQINARFQESCRLSLHGPEAQLTLPPGVGVSLPPSLKPGTGEHT